MPLSNGLGQGVPGEPAPGPGADPRPGERPAGGSGLFGPPRAIQKPSGDLPGLLPNQAQLSQVQVYDRETAEAFIRKKIAQAAASQSAAAGDA